METHFQEFELSRIHDASTIHEKRENYFLVPINYHDVLFAILSSEHGNNLALSEKCCT